jgi:hypothetical protein
MENFIIRFFRSAKFTKCLFLFIIFYYLSNFIIFSNIDYFNSFFISFLLNINLNTKINSFISTVNELPTLNIFKTVFTCSYTLIAPFESLSIVSNYFNDISYLSSYESIYNAINNLEFIYG